MSSDICENHDDLFEAPLFHPTVHLGFGGELMLWVYVDAYNKQMVLHVLNPGLVISLSISEFVTFARYVVGIFLRQ